jgi:hypothetical protein
MSDAVMNQLANKHFHDVKRFEVCLQNKYLEVGLLGQKVSK